MPISGIAPFNVQFTDTSNANATAWAWQFGDGSTSTSQNPTHAYTTPGTYTVLLTITTPNGVASHTDIVTVGSTLLTDLAAFWKMDEASGTRVDSVGSSDLEEVGGTIDFAVGQFGRAAKFVAADEYYLESASDVTLSDAGFSVAFWVKQTSLSSFQELVQIGIGPSGPGINIFSGAAGQVTAEVFDASLASTSATVAAALADLDVQHFVCAWWNPSDEKVSVYHYSTTLAPATEESAGTVSAPPTDGYPVTVGVSPGTVYHLDAAINQLGVWNRVITTAEIAELVAQEFDPTPVTPTAWTPSASSAGTPGYDPQVMLRLSNDGGKNWISEQWRSAGKLGEYEHRVRWNRLGMARRRVFEVSVTDPIPWRITGAYLKMRSSKKG